MGVNEQLCPSPPLASKRLLTLLSTRNRLKRQSGVKSWCSASKEGHPAEEAGLSVFSAWGRWLAVWRVLDEPAEGPDAVVPEKLRYDVVSLHEDPRQPYGLGLSEV